MAGRFVIAEWMPALDANGAPISDAIISVYVDDTSSLAVLYSDETLTVPIANPVEANNAGQFPVIWVDDSVSYTASVTTSYGPPGRPTTYNGIRASAELEASQYAEQAEVALQATIEAASEVVDAAAQTQADRILAQQAAETAERARLTAGFYPEATEDVPRGIITVQWVAGTGYTNGTYDIATTGGSLDVQGSVRVTVAGGAITNVQITGTGLYIGDTPANPSVSVASLGAGSGGSITALLGFLIPSGQYYWADSTDPTLGQLYQNDEGNATLVPDETFLKLTSGVDPVVPSTVGGGANAITMSPSLPISGTGIDQEFWGFAGGNNTTAMTCAIPGVFGGAATAVVMPSGNVTPAGAVRTSFPIKVKPAIIAGNNRYVLTSPTFQAIQSVTAATVISQIGGATVARVTNPDVRTAADLSGTRVQMKMTADKVLASPTVELRAFDGVTVIVPAAGLRDKNDAATLQPANLWAANDTLTMERILPSGRWNLVQTSELVTEPLTDAIIAADYKTPKPLRPVSTLQQGRNLSVLGVKMPLSSYVDTTFANNEDFLRVGYMNVAPFMSLTTEAPGGFLALNSLWAMVRNQKVTICNFVYRALDSGTTVETGLVWSAFENVLIAGDMANAGNPSQYGVNFQLSGRAHGHVSVVTTSRVGYRKDSSVGVPTAATKGPNLTVTLNTTTQAQIGERMRFSSVTGMTQLNNTWFTITGIAGNPSVVTFAGVDSTSWGTFTGATDPAEREVLGLNAPSINTEWDGLRVVQNASYYMNTPTMQKWALCTDSTTFGNGEILFEWESDFTDPAVGIDPGTRTGSYAVMCPTTGMNRAVGYVNGVQGPVQVVDTRNSSVPTNFGFAEKLVIWNADFPDIQLIVENICGPGFTHFDNGIGVPYAAQVFGQNNDYGCKFYWPIYPVSTPVSLAGKVLNGGARYRIVRAAPIT